MEDFDDEVFLGQEELLASGAEFEDEEVVVDEIAIDDNESVVIFTERPDQNNLTGDIGNAATCSISVRVSFSGRAVTSTAQASGCSGTLTRHVWTLMHGVKRNARANGNGTLTRSRSTRSATSCSGYASVTWNGQTYQTSRSGTCGN